MNTNNTKRHMGIVERAKHSLVGKLVCRVMGEETGAVMMEYVIVAVLIAAAVAAGAWFFGKDIMNMFGVAGRSATGDDDAARKMQQEAQTKTKAGHKQADTTNKNWIKTEGEDKSTIE